MTLTTAEAFTQFLSDITAIEYQENTLIPARKRTVDEHLLQNFPSTSDMPYSRGLIMGSVSKDTIIRPIDDADILAILSNK